MASPSQLWYVPHRPDLLCIAPCDSDEPLPGPGAMFVSIDHLHSQPSTSAPSASSSSSQQQQQRWRHPRATPFLTAFGDIAKQQPRVVRCACGQKPCALTALREAGGRGAVPDEAIPADWATKWSLPPAGPEHEASENRRASALQMWLDCTQRAERELPPEPGHTVPPEQAILAAAEVLLTDYVKGRVCFACSVPSTKMQKCSRCQQARYCSKECQRQHWRDHKAECAALAAVDAAAAAAAAAPAASEAAPAAKPAEGAQAASAEQPAAPAPALAAEGAAERAAEAEVQKAA
ncbi:hypothetical protein GPECTOR_16g547 [Gonium pectorale]|uniref:MYND-type domain-containing protein n=1 Tax=Gonium pectorale TaxID=33097 RepID=A0A150GKQ9_GONPE|nr:hypothetical protein GPECTOR_16g547 [Gonium pectorale]|eukprot:KXZ50374.1 hypothetical protein GPECTOR_16g547 [Gonium pectorale]